MSRGDKLLWCSFAGIVVMALGFWLASCGGVIPEPQRAQAKSCLELANEALETATTCDEARVAIAKAVEKAPTCAALFGLHLNLDGDAGVIRCDD